ncbi:MAG TPA: peptidase [Gemmatimonadota bacterium]|nr:peptidase [Gemmatimonadota bacterium]
MRRGGMTWTALFVLMVAASARGQVATVDLPPAELAPGLTPEELASRVERFAPVELAFDASLLDAHDRVVVKKLVEASDVLNEIFRLQVWRKNLDYRAELADAQGPGLDVATEYYDIMAGPWDRVEDDEPFLDVGPKPAGAGYYPEDASKEEIEAWLQSHPQDREAFASYYTVIERRGDDLVAVPYREVYQDRLARVSALLAEAAEHAANPSLKDFLAKRADSFVSDDYLASEIAWMQLSDNLIEPTIGPYEVYEDAFMGWKAAYESFIAIKDPGASEDLEVLVEHLRDLEAALPMDDAYKSLDRSFESPLSVADAIYTAGDARRGIMTLAYNLPNDPRVSEEYGTKKVMLRNVIDAKFEKVLVPIAERIMEPSLAAEIEPRSFTTFIVMHELAHGLGPRVVQGTEESVSVRLAASYSPIEEAKADVVGVLSLAQLADDGVYTQEFKRQVYISSVAGLFRCVRFGTSDAHGKGCAVQLNHLLDAGAISVGQDGRFGIDFERIHDGYESLARDLLTIEATGDVAGAEALLAAQGDLPATATMAIGRLADVPVDIRPVYPVVEAMRDW